MIEIRVNFDPAASGNLKNTEAARVLKEVGRCLLALAGEVADAGTEPAPNKRGRPPKDTPAETGPATSEPIPAAATTDEDLFGEEPAKAAATLTMEDVKATAKNLMDKKSVEPCKKILAELGFKKVTDITPDKFGHFIDLCTKAAA